MLAYQSRTVRVHCTKFKVNPTAIEEVVLVNRSRPIGMGCTYFKVNRIAF